MAFPGKNYSVMYHISHEYLIVKNENKFILIPAKLANNYSLAMKTKFQSALKCNVG